MRADAPVFIPKNVVPNNTTQSCRKSKPRKRKGQAKQNKSDVKSIGGSNSNNTGEFDETGNENISKEKNHIKNKRRNARRKMKNKGNHGKVPNRNSCNTNQSHCRSKNRQRRKRKQGKKSLENVEDILDLNSFPSISIATKAKDSSIAVEAKDSTDHTNKSIWKNIAYEGHKKSQLLHLAKQKEQERIQYETETYTRLDILRPKQSQLLDETEPGHGHKVSLTPNTRLLNMTKLKTKWFRVLEEWRIEKENQRLLDEENMGNEADSTNADESDISSSESSIEVSDCSSSDESFWALESKLDIYLSQRYPLHSAILDGNESAIKSLINLPPHETQRDAKICPYEVIASIRDTIKPDVPVRYEKVKLTLVQFAVIFQKPDILRALLECSYISNLHLVSSNFSVDGVDELKWSPLMIACIEDSEPCVKILLQYGAKISFKHQPTGDTVLHVACREAELATFSMLLGYSRSNDENKQTSLQRLIYAKNRKNETIFHVISRRGRLDVLDYLLEKCSFSSVEKALTIEDQYGFSPLLCAVHTGKTEIVRRLLTWRGNYRIPPTTPSECPLVLAVESKNADMVQTLLDCRATSVSILDSFDFHTALTVLILNYDDDDPSAHRLLVAFLEDGANPFDKVTFIQTHGRHEKEENKIIGRTPLSLCSTFGKSTFLSIILDTSVILQYQKVNALKDKNFLKTQPEEYFVSMQTKDDKNTKLACEEAIIETLLACSDDQDHFTESRLRCCVILFKSHNLTISDSGFIKIMKGLQHQSNFTKTALAPSSLHFEYTYHYPVSVIDNGSYVRPEAIKLSQSLLQIKWCRSLLSADRTYCTWMRKNLSTGSDSDTSKVLDESCYFLIDNKRLILKKAILSSKSAKIEAAIRFEEKKVGLSGCDRDYVEVPLDISFEYFFLLTQHCYHGSIFFGLPEDPVKCCEDLLSLYHLAVEYLCPTLAAECEMRLLSSNPYQCFCSNCCEKVQVISQRRELRCFYDVKVLSFILCNLFFEFYLTFIVFRALPT